MAASCRKLLFGGVQRFLPSNSSLDTPSSLLNHSSWLSLFCAQHYHCHRWRLPVIRESSPTEGLSSSADHSSQLPLPRKPVTLGTCLLSQAKHLHTSCNRQGLEEFFGDPKLWHEQTIKSGRAWTVEDLRLKDNETIHKLWYVLLKERNMLLTMEEEAQRQEKYTPGEDRLEKVETSMRNLKKVIQERDEALNELQLGRKEKHPGRWEYTPFGFLHWVKPKEHLVPKYMNKVWASTHRQYDPYMKKYIKLWLEKVKKARWRRARVAYKQEQKMRKRFPDSDMWEDDEEKRS